MTICETTWSAAVDSRGALVVPDGGPRFAVFLTLDDLERMVKAVRLERLPPYDRDARAVAGRVLRSDAEGE